MQKRCFIGSFVVLAFLFVPVLFNFGIVAYIVPTCCQILPLGKSLIRGKWARSCVQAMYVSAYLGVFFLAALTVWHGLSWIRKSNIRGLMQSLALAAVFSCSFARVITYGSIQGRGGTYTFWTAANRYLEKHPVPW